MEHKILEIQNEMTRVDVLAIRMADDDPIRQHHIHRHGYPKDGSSIMVMCLYDGKATNDPYGWTDARLGMGPRTMPVAHNYIIDHFAELKDGDVVDVSFLLSESNAPKIAERLAHA